MRYNINDTHKLIYKRYIYIFKRVKLGCFHGCNNVEDLKAAPQLCVDMSVVIREHVHTHTHTHVQGEVCEEPFCFCAVCTVYENIDGPQGGVCTGSDRRL